jgi:mono/diheme cytochrome c family protein
MHTRLVATVIALIAVMGIATACGGGSEAEGTIADEITIGTGTEAFTVAEGEATEEAATTAAEEGGETAAAAEGDAAAGAAVFSANCASCHALAAAGAAGAIGPNLDELMPTYDQTLAVVTNGKGAMPAFSGSLSEDDIKNVAAYVAETAGQ